MNKKKILKAVYIAFAIVLVGFIAFLVNAFTGNPVSRLLAKNSAEKHIEEAYSDKDFYIEQVFYSFKDGFYHITVSSPSSPDSSFNIVADMLGRINLDTYEDVITNKRNTAYRIGNQYRQAVDNVLIREDFPYETHIAFGDIEFTDREISDMPDVPSFAIVTDTLELDADYDIAELGRKAGRLVIYIYDEDASVEKLSEILINIKSIVNSAGVEFYAIDCVLENHPDGNDTDKRAEVRSFLCDDIYEDGLVQRVAEADRILKEYYAQQDELKKQEEALLGNN